MPRPRASTARRRPDAALAASTFAFGPRFSHRRCLVSGRHHDAHIARRRQPHAAVRHPQDAIERNFVKLDALLQRADRLLRGRDAAVRIRPHHVSDDAAGRAAELQDHVGDAFGVEGVERAFLHPLGDDRRQQRLEQCAGGDIDAVEQHLVFGAEQRLEQRPFGRGVLHLVLPQPRHQRVEPRQRIESGLVQHILHGGECRARQPVGERFEQILLGGEVVIERALRESGLRNHVVEARLVVATRQEQRLRTIQDLGAAHLRMLDDAGHDLPCGVPGVSVGPSAANLE